MVSLFDESNVKISASLAQENIVLEDVQSAFEFDMAIYTDMSFTEIRSKDYKYNVPEKIFVGIVTEVKINRKEGLNLASEIGLSKSFQAPDTRYHLSVEHCFFTGDSGLSSISL